MLASIPGEEASSLGHPAPDPELTPEKPPHNARHHRRPGSPAGSLEDGTARYNGPVGTRKPLRGRDGSPARPSRKHVPGGSSHDLAAVTVETSHGSQASVTNRSSRLGA